MSWAAQCQSCNGEFDLSIKVPMVLPCQHSICYTCANDYFQKNMSIKCVHQACQIVHKTLPLNLQKDEQLLEHLERRDTLSNIALLESYQTKIQSAQIQLSKQQSSLIIKVIHHLNEYVFKNSLVKQRELKQFGQQLRQQLNYLKFQQLQTTQNNPQQGIQENLFNPNLEKFALKLTAEAQEVFQQISQTQTNVLEEIDNLRVQINTLSQTNNKYASQINQLNQQVSLIQQEKNNISKELANTKDSLNQLNQEKNNSKPQINQMSLDQILANKNQVLTTQLNESQSQYHQYQEQFSQIYQQNIVKSSTPSQIQSVKSKSQQKQYLAQQSENQKIQLSIISPNNKSVNLTVKQDSIIRQIKDKIQKQTKLY